MPPKDAERRPVRSGGQHQDQHEPLRATHRGSSVHILLGSTDLCQAQEWDALCDGLVSAWGASDTLWRQHRTPLAYEHTVNVHALARLAYQLRTQMGGAA